MVLCSGLSRSFIFNTVFAGWWFENWWMLLHRLWCFCLLIHLTTRSDRIFLPAFHSVVWCKETQSACLCFHCAISLRIICRLSSKQWPAGIYRCFWNFLSFSSLANIWLEKKVFRVKIHINVYFGRLLPHH